MGDYKCLGKGFCTLKLANDMDGVVIFAACH